MQTLIQIANTIFNPIIKLGGPPVMLILLTILATVMGVKFSKALEGGLKLAIALTGMGAMIDILIGTFNPALQAFVKFTGINLPIIDVGWPPLATITWGSPYTLYFLLIIIIINVLMLILNKTTTLDVDIFNVWHLAFIGLLVMYYSHNNLLLATVLVIIVGILKIINSDLMKPTFNDLLDMPETNPTTTTHLNFMLNPIIMVFDKLIDVIFPFIDKFDFDAATLNNKIGFWGSKFAIGAYLGVFVGLFGHQSIKAIFTLAFTGAVILELFSVIGTWFISAVEPLSQGITNLVSRRFISKRLYIGIDWPFLAARPEMWAAANILAPIMLGMALILPGNRILPLGGIIAIGLTPALLVVTRGKIIRMTIIGTVVLPLFLWVGTLTAPFVTHMAKVVGAFPTNVSSSSLIGGTTIEGPIEKLIAIVWGEFGGNMNITSGLEALVAIVIYILVFIWYAYQMKKRNEEYKKNNETV
ncbi:MAG: galactose system component [Tepidanaerobacteraceae bacterium]|nr:galactose system component [Tepidanaerobacteraceae bacterium]